jgi:hypothetical protein
MTKIFFHAVLAFFTLSVLIALARNLSWSEADYITLNASASVALTLGAIWFGVLIVIQDPRSIWTPALLFFGHVALFRGIGPLIYIFGNTATLEKITSGAWGITQAELLESHLLNAVGTCSILLGIFLLLLRKKPTQEQDTTSRSRISVAQAAWFFLIPGIIIRYGIIIPNTFTETKTLVIPGAVIKLSFLVDVGFSLLAMLAVQRGRAWLLLFWILFIPHYFTLFLEFKKSALVLGALLPIIGAYVASGNFRGLMRNMLVLVVIYLASQPVVHHGRSEMSALSGSVFGASFSQRVGITADLFLGDTTSVADIIGEEETQSGWLRLSYAANQAIAMRAYETSGPANTIRGVWQVFIPRFLWPEKPTFTYLGRDFYFVITGRDSGTLVGSTIYADSYWNYGWPGVIAIGVTIGLFFGFATSLTLNFIRRQDFIYLPAIMMAMDMAMRQLNGWVLTGFFGQMPFYFGFLGLVWVFSKFINGLARSPNTPGAATAPG